MKPRVVVVGGGFGGLAAAKALRRAPVDVILIDRTNHHLFQPLLYQVATSVLAPGQIGTPIRSILRKQRNTRDLRRKSSSVNPSARVVLSTLPITTARRAAEESFESRSSLLVRRRFRRAAWQ